MRRIAREEAASEAAVEFAALGFVESAPGTVWQGRVNDGPWAEVQLTVTLPDSFPDSLPVVRLDRNDLPKPIPHVENDGKICIAPSSGVLVDSTRPKELVRDAVARARDIVMRGSRGDNAAGFLEEFNAYWGATLDVLSFCAQTNRVTSAAMAVLAPKGPRPSFLVASSAGELHRIVGLLELEVEAEEEALLIPLQSVPYLPPFESEVPFRIISSMLRNHVASEVQRSISRETVPSAGIKTILFSYGLREAMGSLAFALRLSNLRELNGFRKGRTPIAVAVAQRPDAKAVRISVQRGDAAFLTTRTGSQSKLDDKRVAVVGCGAIGGYLAATLADSGVGSLTLIDPETLRAENALRHVLGFYGVGLPKVEALKNWIQKRLPSLRVDPHPVSADTLLAQDETAFNSCDVIVLATGDHSAELHLSQTLRGKTRLVHVWVEAYGAGGHVFVDGGAVGGCLACLFDTHEEHGLYCRASFLAPGQAFTTMVGGCAGVFTPFGSSDAQRAAIEAARVTVRILDAHTPAGAHLTSWSEIDHSFRSDVRLSGRVKVVSKGHRAETSAAEIGSCQRCAP